MDQKAKRGRELQMISKGQCINMYAPLVGGLWDNSSGAGVFALLLNAVASNSNNNVGLRDSDSKPDTTLVDTGTKGVHCPAISETKQKGYLSSRVENLTPKRIGYLYEKISTQEALYNAYLEARKGKRSTRACFEFERHLGSNIEALAYELQSKTYRPREYTKFFVYEPKMREINAPHFRDLVVQHAIYKEINGIFDRSFIDHSYACRKGMGTHSASLYTQKEMRRYNGGMYSLKLDIRKFFYRIDREILQKLFEKKIKDKAFVELMMSFTKMDTPLGIPIGNLLSQLYALIYLNPLDHFIKRILKIKSYVRYVDDFVLIGITKERAKVLKVEIEKFLSEKLNLVLSKWTIAPIKKGINFVGYRTWRTKRFVRRHSIAKFKKAIKRVNLDAIISLLGHARATQSLRLFGGLLHQALLFNFIPRSHQCVILPTHP
jgi:RNA-directed DNA polymerase